ncbi:hypothetical protein DVH24_032885 [Malus domestica]|uniref:RHOMBOID-like protein n=1 Tax=Malus domestica TaxID=3750 RepID=A0A498IT23_MALDO|nr:hypothetical protein DVH24_032885 [Malus domestica]
MTRGGLKISTSLLSALQGKPTCWAFFNHAMLDVYLMSAYRKCLNKEERLEKMGNLDAQRVVHQHQGWRLISCMWLHAGVFHVLADMLSLVFIGIRLEQEFGFVQIGFLYLMSGFGGSLLSALFIQYGISVGASGALFGLLGSMLSELTSNWTMYVNKLAALLTLLFIIIINLAVGILPHVDNFAHIGGFVSGFLLGFLFLIHPQFKWLTQRNAPPGHERKEISSSTITNSYLQVSYATLLRATDGLSEANLIGVGSFGVVYKGVLNVDDRAQMVAAVKVFNLSRHGAAKCFISGCEALRNMKHRNLVKIITACSSVDSLGNDFKALVYEYMEKASLEK